jgi:signal transduction histidine kinase
MSLAARISAFLLVLLAVVLVGFSSAVYLLARTYLRRELDGRLQSALETLAAAVDIEPSGLEWEPADRRIALGVDSGINALRWSIRDGRGVLVDRSANAGSGDFPVTWSPASWPAGPDGTTFGNVPHWRMAGRRLSLDDLLRQGRGHPDDQPGYEVQYRALELVAGVSPAPVEAALNRLGLTLGALSIAVWVGAAAAGHGWLWRRALAPMRRMTRAAAAMTPTGPAAQLPLSGNGDELDELGRAFNDLLDRLGAVHEQQRRFAGEASHQLRTPLAALLGQVQVARRRERSPAEYRRVLDVVQAEGERLRHIVETLLLLAQPTAAELPTQPLDLARWVPDHLRRWAEHPRAADLVVKADADSLTVHAHPTLLGQLVDNLVENAFKYSAAGTPVTVTIGGAGASATLSVDDRGQGLTAEDAARVFEPFFRAERARRDGQAGVGLGLAVARRIAEACGGSLELCSTPGVGSRFRVSLARREFGDDAGAANSRRATMVAESAPVRRGDPPVPH